MERVGRSPTGRNGAVQGDRVPHLSDEPLESGDVRGDAPDQVVHPLPVVALAVPLEDRAQRDHGRQRDQRRVEWVDPGGVPVAEDLPGLCLQLRDDRRIEGDHAPAVPRHRAGLDELVLDRPQRAGRDSCHPFG
jgi:hypothetical protein